MVQLKLDDGNGDGNGDGDVIMVMTGQVTKPAAVCKTRFDKVDT